MRPLRWLTLRLGAGLLGVLSISLLVFLAIRLLPSDPARVILGPARRLFQALESEQERADQLDIEFDQLQIELSTWATSPRIEKIAREKLKMRTPEPAKVIVVSAGEAAR